MSVDGFRRALESAGFHPRTIVPDGRIRRCPTDLKPTKANGWHVLHPDGHGVYGDWTTGSSEPLGYWNGENPRYDPSAIQKMKERLLQAKRDAIRAVRAWWAGCQPLREHPYLEKKGLSIAGVRTLRQRGGKLVSPVMGHRGLISVQTIDSEGEKRFWPNAPTRGGSVVLDRQKAPLTVYCEGLATGLAIFQSVKTSRVVVCYSADNIARVVDSLHPYGQMVIAADNDWRTERKIGTNPGIEKATAVAEKIGCGVAYPDDIDGTDWADFLIQYGDRAGPEMQRRLQAKAQYVMRT